MSITRVTVRIVARTGNAVFIVAFFCRGGEEATIAIVAQQIHGFLLRPHHMYIYVDRIYIYTRRPYVCIVCMYVCMYVCLCVMYMCMCMYLCYVMHVCVYACLCNKLGLVF